MNRMGNAAAAAGAAGVGAAALAGLGYGLIQVEAKLARKIVGQPFDGAPDDDGVYGAAPGAPLELVVLGDSTAAGMGADNRYQTIGAILATGLAAMTGRPVNLTNEAVIGAESSDLDRQLALALARTDRVDAAVVLIGANDVTHRIDRASAVRSLERTVRHLRALRIEVVVGTCPDLGTVEPIPFPLSSLLRRWSRELAAAQTIAVVEAGARTVSIGDLLGPEFAASPADMFSQDRFHPSPAGYARVASAILPTLCAALGVWEAADGTTATRDTETTDREASVAPVRTVSEAADAAVRAGGTEVAPVDADRPGPRDRLAVLLRRRRATTPEAPAAAVGANPSAD